MPRTSKTAAGRKAFSKSNLGNGVLVTDTMVAPTYTGVSNTTVTTATTTMTTTSKQPKSVLDKIVYAIRQQPTASTAKGVSRLAITKYLKAELYYDNANAIKTALKKGVDKGVLEQNGQSFRVKGDPIVQADEGPKLEIIDIKVGNSDSNDATNSNDDKNLVAQLGDSVTMKYVGKLDSGYVFDKDSLTFTLGAGDVIKGWDQGIPGMRVGGQRKMVVPSKLGYGKRGCAPDIPGNATLHFEVTLTNIQRPE